MTNFYVIAIYCAVTILLFVFLSRMYKRRSKKLKEKIQSISSEPVVMSDSKPEQQDYPDELANKPESIEIPVESPVESKLEEIENPDKDKPFAKFSSPSQMESKDYKEAMKEPETIPAKPKKKHYKKPTDKKPTDKKPTDKKLTDKKPIKKAGGQKDTAKNTK